jgi:hypothetical protein
MKNSDASANREVPDLELPDWSGMDRFTPRMSTANALRLNEEYRKKFLTDPRVIKAWQEREKIQVEFHF